MIDDKDIVNVTLTLEPKRKVYFDKTKLYGENLATYEKYLIENCPACVSMQEFKDITALKCEMAMRQAAYPRHGDILYLDLPKYPIQVYANAMCLQFVAKESDEGYEWVCVYTPKHSDYDPSKISIQLGDSTGWNKFKRKWLEGEWIETNDRPLSKAEQEYADKKLAKSREEFEKKAAKEQEKIEDNINLLTISNPHANLLGTSQFGYYGHDE